MFTHTYEKMFEIMSPVRIKSFHKKCLVSVVMLCFLSLIIFKITDWKIYSNRNILPVLTNIWSFSDPSLAVTLMSKYQTKDGHFQPVSNGNKTYVYSAYLEESSEKIRIIGITDNRTSSINCVFWYINRRKINYSALVTGFIVKINEGHERQYIASYFICYLLGNEVPDAVSIVENITDLEPTNILPVRRPEVLKEKHNFTVCLSPIQQGYGNTKGLIEWLEIIQLLGATRVAVYVQNTTNDVISVLKSYEANTLVKFLPWVLPEKLCNNNMSLHYCGQLAALNDCILRNKGKSRYVAAFDLDEIIIPQVAEDFTWMDMFKRLTKESVYIFRNSFFFQSEDTFNTSSPEMGMLKITSHQLKDDFIFGATDRSKWIVDTDMVATMGIHSAWAIKSGIEYTVPTDLGLLHHYREQGINYPKGIQVKREKHQAAVKYQNQLESRVAHMYKKLKINFPPES